MEGTTGGGVRVVSRRMVRPLTPPPPPPMANGNGNCYHHHPRAKEKEVEVIHLTPWDLRTISIDYIQKGILLPKPPAGAGGNVLVDALASSFARALRLFYPFAGRLATEERADGTVTVFLRCTGDGAELVHAVAPGVAVADIVSTLRTPPVVWEFYPMAMVLGADAAIEHRDRDETIPVLSVQVTELADGVFVGMALNHSVGDGTAFWHFFKTWSEINRRGDLSLSTPPPVLRRWFLDTCPVPIPMPFRKLEHIVRRFERTPVQECFFTFSAASVKKLKARVNGEIAGAATATATISSLQAVLAPDALVRLITDAEFMNGTMMAEPYSVMRSPLKKKKKISCYAHASIPSEKLIMGQAPTGLGVVIRGLRGQGHNKGLVHVQAHISDPTDQDSAETMAMQLAAEICEHLNLQDVKFLIGSDYCSAVANGQLGQQLPLPVRRNVITTSGRICEFVKLSKAVQLHTEAHKLAKKARQSLPRTECSFTWSSMHDNHGEWCSVIQTIQNVEWPGHFSLLSVNCT